MIPSPLPPHVSCPPRPAMIRRVAARLRHDTDGAVTIPTLFWLPVFFMILLMSVELMVINMRQVLLDRAVDVATRDLRLGNGTVPSLGALKSRICSVIAFVPDCHPNLSVDIFPIDTQTWALTSSQSRSCRDNRAGDIDDPAPTEAGGNKLVVLRACLRLQPMTGIDPLALALHRDASGRFTLSTATVFVNEPRNTGQGTP